MEFFAFFVFWRIGKGILHRIKQKAFSTEMEGISQGEKRVIQIYITARDIGIPSLARHIDSRI